MTGLARTARPLVASLLLGGAVLACPAGAVTVHTWVDEAGVRHYADSPPADASGSEALTLADTGPSADPGEDYYSVVNQWQRMREEREANDALELERERLVNERRALAAQAEPPPADYGPRYAWPGYFPYGYGQGFRPGGFGGRRHGGVQRGGHRRNSNVHATPPVWPRLR